jgi:Tol biopolymer transport system component
VYDQQTGSTVKASVGVAGAQAIGMCHSVSLSTDGRYVAFQSDATNLVVGDTNGQPDSFVRDLLAGVTTRVPVISGSWSPCLSGDGTRVAFWSGDALVPGDTNNLPDVFVYDFVTAAITRASVGDLGQQGNGNSGSWGLAVSGDGTAVAFTSQATNLVPQLIVSTSIFVRQ